MGDLDPQKPHRGATDGPVKLTDPEEFAAQYRDAYARLHLIATGIMGDRTLAEDVVQEAAIIAFQKADQFVVGSNFVAWLSEIVRRCALNQRRKFQRRRTFTTDPALLGHLTDDRSQSGDPLPMTAKAGDVARWQEAFDDELLHGLGELAEVPRCCLLLRTVLHLTYVEIAELLAIPEGTVMSHVHRSKAKLRELLAPSRKPDSASTEGRP